MKFARVTLFISLALPTFTLGDVLFTDSSFPTSSYPVAFSFTQNNTTANDAGTVSDGSGPAQCASCGDPGTALQTTFNITVTGTSGNTEVVMDVGVINSAFSYDPSVNGALQFVSGSVDESNTNSNPGFPPQVQFDLFIQQGSNFYYNSGAFVQGAGFQLLSATDLIASNFDQINANGTVNSSSHPDFTSGPMDFGLLIIGGDLGAPATNETYIYDNLTLDLTPTPEPATFVAMAAALVGLAIFGLRRARWVR